MRRLWLRFLARIDRKDRFYRAERTAPGFVPKSPWGGTMRTAPPPPPEKTRKLHFPHLRHREHCDACGRAADLIGISAARFEIVTSRGSLFLCGHHYRKHRFDFHERAYEVIEHG
jgi:hypothetical protein